MRSSLSIPLFLLSLLPSTHALPSRPGHATNIKSPAARPDCLALSTGAFQWTLSHVSVNLSTITANGPAGAAGSDGADKRQATGDISLTLANPALTVAGTCAARYTAAPDFERGGMFGPLDFAFPGGGGGGADGPATSAQLWYDPMTRNFELQQTWVCMGGDPSDW